MKYNFTNLFQKSILLFALFLISFMFAQNPDLEMTTGGGSTANGPSTSINVNFSKNSDNPTGSTYNTYTVASGLSVTFSLQNFTAAYQGTTISGGNSVSFGHTGSTVAPQYGQFTTGAPTNVLFTSSTSTAGTGIIVNGTAATNNYGVVVKAYTSKLNPTVPRNGRVKQAELKIVFSRPVNNPILQITGLGGASGSNGFSSEFTVNTGLSDAISGITRLSGTTAFAVSGLNVTNNAVPMTASGAGVGSGSVRIDGTNITTIVLDVYMHGDGTGNLNSWGNGTNADTSGDAFVIGFTATESDLEITKTVSPTAALVGDNVVFNLTAKNNGASNNTNVSVNDLLPTGYTYDSHIASTGAASYVPGTGVWTVGNLNDGATRTLTIYAKVNATGNYTNTAVISTTSGVTDPNLANNTADATVTVVCVEKVEGKDFAANDGSPQTFTQPATNFGFVFDIFELDNSFTLNINGTDLATSEIQFQSAATPPPGINIRFVDGDLYEVDTPDIWQMDGTAAAPLIRVIISPTGVVSMYGSKVSGGPLFPLELFNGNAFNTITWNPGAPNTIIATQVVTGPTYISGTGYGLNVVPCACYDDANTATAGVPTNHGITLLQRAGGDNGNWPMIRNSAYTVLESNTKGFVVTRIPTADFVNITNPIDGMMVYDTTEKCLKIYTVDEVTSSNTGWKCYNLPACP